MTPGLRMLPSMLRALKDGDAKAWSRLSLALSAALLVGLLLYVLEPMLADFSTFGFHDWDVATAYRYITVVSLRSGEGPWWHPFLCGGVQGWGYSEGATNFVSPYLPLYLLLDVRAAIRLEVLGQGLLGLAGAYLFAGLFTTSAALRAFLGALFVLNGRWALQAAVGHTWHLQYALLPWAFFFFERSLRDKSLRWAAGAGAVLALQCFWGGIYPLPHTALFLSLYALVRAGLDRRARPLVAIGITAVVAVGLAAPKLFAALDQLRVLPRLIESTEVIGPLELYAMLTAPDQRYGERPIVVPAYNWHEWGLYIGPVGLATLPLALLARGSSGQALKVLGVLSLLLGFGAFHPWSPWALLHELPLFASQHVPSRFHYPMLLFLGSGFVLAVSGFVTERIARRPWLDAALLVPVALFGWDMARYSRTPFEQAFWMEAPAEIQRVEPFEHRRRSPVSYVLSDWARPVLLAMFANTGVVECYGVDPEFRVAAKPAGAPGYRGRAYVEGAGTATLVDWSPNRAVVEVSGAPAGALVVYNMNHDASWRANGAPALEHQGLVAARLDPGVRTITFRYLPRTLAPALGLFMLTLVLVLIPPAFWQKLRARLSR